MPEEKEEPCETNDSTEISIPKKETSDGEISGEEAEEKEEPYETNNSAEISIPKKETSDGEVSGEDAEEKEEPRETNNSAEISILKKETSDSEVEDEQEPLQMSKLKLGLLFVGLIFASFLASLDGTIVSTTLPRIASDLKAIDKYSWAATSYLLTYNAFQPLYGKFSDIFGRRSTMTFSVLVFLIGSTGSGVAKSFDVLILFRAVQGIGGSGMLAMVFITISDLFPLEERLKYQVIVWTTFGISFVVGPVLGGSFVDHLTWRWAFYINIPFGVLAIFCVLAFLKLPFTYTSFKDKLLRIDWLGSILIVSIVIAIILPTSWGGITYPWKSAPVISLYCASVVLTGLFAWVEHRWAVEPIMPRRVFNLTVVAVFVTNFLTGVVLFSAVFYVPLFFQAARGYTATISGLQLLPLLLGLVIFSMASGILAYRTPGGYKIYITIGCMIVTVGMGLLSTFSEDISRIKEIFYLLILGIGFGLELQMCLIAAQSAVTQEDMAIVTALANFFQSIGGAIGISIANSLINNYMLNHIPTFFKPDVNGIENSISGISSLPEPLRTLIINIFVNSLQLVFKINIAFAGAAFVSCLFIKSHRMISMKKSTAVMA